MTDRRRGSWGRAGLLGAMTLAIAACGVEAESGAAPAGDSSIEFEVLESPPAKTATDAGASNVSESSVGAAVVPELASAEAAPAAQQLDQPAIWPAADVVFVTPEEAAADFVSSVLGVSGDPVLGPFQQGDAGSGEIDVLWAGETGDLDPPQTEGTLLLRQLGPSDGWFIIEATSPDMKIDTPSTGDEVAAGLLTVAGEGLGFEGTLNIFAFPPGDSDTSIDTQLGAGGVFELRPYSVELDLSSASAGDVVAIVVRGASSLAIEPGPFAAIPVVIEASDNGGAGDDGSSDDGGGTTPATTIPVTE